MMAASYLLAVHRWSFGGLKHVRRERNGEKGSVQKERKQRRRRETLLETGIRRDREKIRSYPENLEVLVDVMAFEWCGHMHWKVFISNKKLKYGWAVEFLGNRPFS